MRTVCTANQSENTRQMQNKIGMKKKNEKKEEEKKREWGREKMEKREGFNNNKIHENVKKIVLTQRQTLRELQLEEETTPPTCPTTSLQSVERGKTNGKPYLISASSPLLDLNPSLTGQARLSQQALDIEICDRQFGINFSSILKPTHPADKPTASQEITLRHKK